MTITDFFDVESLEHIEAYNYLRKNKVWPEEFYDKIKNLEFPSGFMLGIACKLAQKYIDDFLEKHKNETS